jgi:hypothetical protein
MAQGERFGLQLAELHLSSSLAINALRLKSLELERRRRSGAGLDQQQREGSLAKIDEETGN